MTAPGERTKQRMVRGAAELLRQRGYTGTGFREVIELTGAPRGSIYHHFPGGKAQLAGEAVDHVGALARDVIAAPLADADPIGALRGFVELWRADFERSGYRAGCPIAAVAVENHDEAPELLDAAARAFDNWRSAFSDCLRAAGVPAARAQPARDPGRLRGRGRDRAQPRRARPGAPARRRRRARGLDRDRARPVAEYGPRFESPRTGNETKMTKTLLSVLASGLMLAGLAVGVAGGTAAERLGTDLQPCGKVNDEGGRSPVKTFEVGCNRAREIARDFIQDDVRRHGWRTYNPAGCGGSCTASRTATSSSTGSRVPAR